MTAELQVSFPMKAHASLSQTLKDNLHPNIFQPILLMAAITLCDTDRGCCKSSSQSAGPFMQLGLERQQR